MPHPPRRRSPIALALLALPWPIAACGDDAGDTVVDPDAPVASCFPTPSTPEAPGRPAEPAPGPVLGGGGEGAPLVLGGRVLGLEDCEPLPQATLVLWHADGSGRTDPGSLVAGAVDVRGGTFEVTTVYPGPTGAGEELLPPEVHVAVSAPGHETLVTTLRFAGEDNGGHDPLLVLDVATGATGRVAAVDLVLRPEDR